MFTILGDRLKHLRNEKLMLQKDIAVLLNISKSAYGFYEQGKRTPDCIMLSKIADVFEVSTDYLLGRTNIRIIDQSNSAFSIGADELDEEDLEYIKGLVERLKSKHSNKLK